MTRDEVSMNRSIICTMTAQLSFEKMAFIFKSEMNSNPVVQATRSKK